jgi:hypothetical protein
MKYALIEVLLSWKEQRTPELHAAQYSPVLVNPATALPEKEGDLLKGQYIFLLRHCQNHSRGLILFRAEECPVHAEHSPGYPDPFRSVLLI